ncbi:MULTISPECIES: F0F1 ATP synthase subunit B family protein [Phenylobacterium]|uniref:ATP synthase subunit b n=1 Tax=Phenylobacterium koreense TaxID=266125 RepID=A0ABV2EFF3_9CAUL
MAAETPSPADAAVAEHGANAPAGTTEVAAHGGGESGGGLPQFEFEHWGGQIVWLFLIFAVLYILLAKVFIPRLRKIQDDRAATIADAVNQARSVQAEAEAQAKAAQAEIDEARARARSLAVEAKAKAAAQLAASQKAEDDRLQAKMEEAEGRIRGLRDQAMTNVRGIAGETAQAMVEKLTGQKVTAAEIDAALTARAQGAA